ncbi:MAG: D-aminoacyl-tRNA deacylase [Candidatus Erginobacter occultus]|nr:D-aminoacyl-tRNA deacylase [Candidatus Erginobacter occultus]
MKAVIQRVRSASVAVAGEEVSRIGPGLLVLLGVGRGDTEGEADWLAEKIAGLRIFPDKAGKMNLSLRETGGEILAVSQFTLYGDCRHGRRPGFSGAAPPAEGERLYDYFCRCLEEAGFPPRRGVFGKEMLVRLENDGPVTIILEKN